MRHLTPRELQDHLARAASPPLLLDVREPWEYRIVHLPDSVLVPMRQVPATVGDWDRDQEIVVVCHHGIRSWQVGLWLEQAGFSRVINLKGGIDAWAREVDTAMPTY